MARYEHTIIKTTDVIRGKDNIPYFKDPWSHTYGSFNAEGYQPIIMLNYRLPSDFDEKKGVFDFTNTNRSMFFNGIYQVVKIESSIAQGSFTQTLHCVRLNNQKGTGKEAAKFTTGLNEKDNKENTENIKREIWTPGSGKVEEKGRLNT